MCSQEPLSSSAKTSKRQVTKATFDKWQREHDRQHQTLSWLRCELERDNLHVASLHCAVCRKYKGSLRSLRSFSAVWISGSTNQKVSNVVDHATSDIHKVAMERKRAESVKASSGSVALSSAIGRCLSTMDGTTQARMGRKFDVCFVMAKEGIPFTKYPALLQLEQRHAVDLGHAYNTPDSAKLFTGFIAKCQLQAFLSSFYSSGSHFFSLLMDGTTDAGDQEDELIVLVYCYKDEANEELTARTRYLSLHRPQKADASGLLLCVGEAVMLLGVENVLDKDSVLGVEGKPVLVGVGTDGATVNVAQQNGLRGKMQRALPWLFWSWCYAHRLELACKGAFTSSQFSSIQEMLLRLYYIYEKSPKKSRDLACIVDDLKQVYDFSNGGDLPIRSCGTRWITHKRMALQRVLDRYGAYIAHLSTLVEDKSIKPCDRARLKGYLLKWKQPEVLVSCALYVEVLKPLSILSLTLQSDSADIVISIENTLKSTKALRSLTEKDPSQWQTVQLVHNRIKEIDGHKEYQGVPLQNIDDCLDRCKAPALADIQRLHEQLKTRLEWSDVNLLRAILVFLETQSWLQRNDPSNDDPDSDDGLANIRAALDLIITAFHAPLESKGVALETIQDELEEAVGYARRYLRIGTQNLTEKFGTNSTRVQTRANGQMYS